jgi:hypothetical protein
MHLLAMNLKKILPIIKQFVKDSYNLRRIIVCRTIDEL